MRTILLAIALFVIVLACAGAAAVWYATEPMRFAGIKRDASHLTTIGALVDLEHPDATRREIIELLKARDFATLSAIIDTRAQRAIADPKEEFELNLR